MFKINILRCMSQLNLKTKKFKADLQYLVAFCDEFFFFKLLI